MVFNVVHGPYLQIIEEPKQVFKSLGILITLNTSHILSDDVCDVLL